MLTLRFLVPRAALSQACRRSRSACLFLHAVLQKSSRKCRGQQKKRGKIWCVRKKPYLCTRKTKKAEIAQLVEHFIRNERVAGSSPAFGSRNSGISRETAIYNGLGSLAQLNRASDYGSEGYRFESYRSHFIAADTLQSPGSLAQLNRASDYGSEGYRFESYRSHTYTTDSRNQPFGSLAQLNRASDYGSEGYRFESYRSHLKDIAAAVSFFGMTGMSYICGESPCGA